MKTFLFALFLLVSHIGIGQNRVVKDNIACLYGIKNPEGNWVVKPKYILLTGYTYGYFVVQEGPNYGLLAHDGTELLPCEYSKIKPLNYSWSPVGVGHPVNQQQAGRTPFLFQVEKDNKRALIDATGKTLVPLKTQFFRTDGQQHVIVTEYREPNLFTSYIDVQGNYVFKDLPGAIEPFRSQQIALVGLRTPGSNGTVEGNVRLINKKGEYIGNHVFDRALVCGQNRVVFEDSLGHIGTMDATGRIIIQPKYQLVFNTYLRENILPCLYSSQHTFMIKDDTGKFGLMDGTGKVVCTPQYDGLEQLVGYWKTDQTEYRIKKNGKTGMLSKNGQVSIPCNYDTLIPFKLNYDRNVPLDGFVAANSNRYGLIKLNGDTIIPIEHPFFERTSSSRSALFGNTKELFEIDASLKITPIEQLVELEDFTVFNGTDGHHFVLKEGEDGQLAIIQSKQFMNVIWFQERGSNCTILSTAGKQLDSGNVHSIDQRFRFILARTSEGTRYLIDAKTASRITEPVKSAEFQLHISSMDQVWSKGLVDPIDSWVLLDTNGRRSGEVSFDQPFNLSADRAPLLQDGYWGIYNIKDNEWLLSPNYVCIDAISEEVFTAKLKNGKWELHSLSAKKVLGPFESLKFICGGIHVDRFGKRNVNNMLFLAYQNGNSLLINPEGEKISNPTQIKRIQTELAYGVYESGGKLFSGRGGISIGQNEPDFEVTTLYEQLFDVVKELYPDPNHTPQHSEVDTRNCGCKTITNRDIKTELRFAKPNATSVEISRYVSPSQPWDVGYYETTGYINAILVNGELKQIELRAIFGNNDQLLYNEFKRVIQTDETLNLECSTVENMLELVRNNFKFDEKGLILIVDQNSRRPANITIPWERLAQVPTTRSFAKIFIE